MEPHEGIGACAPIPKKLKPASINIAEAKLAAAKFAEIKVAKTQFAERETQQKCRHTKVKRGKRSETELQKLSNAEAKQCKS